MTDPAIFDIAPQRALAAPVAGGTDAGADAAEQFEALVVGELAKLMVSTLPTDGPFGGGHAEG
ncbi:MAG: flagellar biosynthesis protein FlgJ, partial [Pseudomonadota bacterium]